jgi:hypothetical protein
MFSDGLVDLVNRGVVTNEDKKVERGKIVTTFVLGTRKVYDFVNVPRPVWQLASVGEARDICSLIGNHRSVEPWQRNPSIERRAVVSWVSTRQRWARAHASRHGGDPGVS